MKTKIHIITILIFTTVSMSFYPFENNPDDLPNETAVISYKQLDGNNISTFFGNNGSFNRNPVTGNGGFEWPKGSSKFLRYASGVWLAGKVADDTLVAVVEYSYEFLPGFINSNGNPEGKDDPDFRVYKIVKGDTLSEDYLNWPVSQGAYLDSAGRPFLPGTQTMFYSMTDGFPESHTNHAGSTAPLMAQIQVTHWCYNDYPPTELRNVIFTEYKIINKNSLPWNDAHFSIWTDDHQDESIANGCDSLMNLGFAYCSPNSFNYGNTPPAFSFLLHKGPEVYTGNPNDTVYTFTPGQIRRIKVGFKELNMSSFHNAFNAAPNGKPNNYRETYLTMQGFKPTGESWINPITNTVTKFPYSGDPESGTGWIQYIQSGYGNRRQMMSIGKLNINPGDTQTIVFAQIVSQGINNLNSVTKLKQTAAYVKNVFDNNFTTVDIKNNAENFSPDGFKLAQNFPNPFNPETVISYELPFTGFAELSVYDILGNEVAELVNEKRSAGSYEVKFDGSNVASGVYFYKLTAGKFSETKRMILLK